MILLDFAAIIIIMTCLDIMSSALQSTWSPPVGLSLFRALSLSLSLMHLMLDRHYFIQSSLDWLPGMTLAVL